jgi:DNA-binding response OmpR family regulator
MSETIPRFFTSDEHLPDTEVLIFSSNAKFIDNHFNMLLSLGFVPITVTTLEAAVVILRMTVIELVIVDEETGVPETQSLLGWVRDNRQGVPVLVVSQRSNDVLRHQALELGAAGYLDRPVFQDDVVQAILAHCARGGNPLWGPQFN